MLAPTPLEGRHSPVPEANNKRAHDPIAHLMVVPLQAQPDVSNLLPKLLRVLLAVLVPGICLEPGSPGLDFFHQSWRGFALLAHSIREPILGGRHSRSGIRDQLTCGVYATMRLAAVFD